MEDCEARLSQMLVSGKLLTGFQAKMARDRKRGYTRREIRTAYEILKKRHYLHFKRAVTPQTKT
jgi:hypothetical protein